MVWMIHILRQQIYSRAKIEPNINFIEKIDLIQLPEFFIMRFGWFFPLFCISIVTRNDFNTNISKIVCLYFSLANDLPRLDPNLIRTIRSIASVDTIIARAALNEINDILESPEKQAALRDYEELYVDSICVQFMVNIKYFTKKACLLRFTFTINCLAFVANTNKWISDYVSTGIEQYVHVFHI